MFIRQKQNGLQVNDTVRCLHFNAKQTNTHIHSDAIGANKTEYTHFRYNRD